MDEYDDLWIDIPGFTKKDWDWIEAKAIELAQDGHFKGNLVRCVSLALAYYVSEGYGLREPEH